MGAGSALRLGGDPKSEFVVTDADMVAVVEGGRRADALMLHMDTVGRAEVVDDVVGPGVDDDGVVAADVGVVQDDVVVTEAPDARRRLRQRVALPVAMSCR